ncbi:thioredoxin family protein [Brevibacillus centrosporus]|uniref:thioredoxin family protein n=1 Tax=Brevibacillus centrosporus TaxID=54910 RepID=UPI003B0132FD
MALLRKWWIWGSALLLIGVTVLAVQMSRVSDDKNKIVYVYSDTCGYCSSFTPKFDKVLNDYSDWKVEKLEISNQESYQKAMDLGAEATPTVFVVQEGKPVEKLEGDVSEKALRNFFQKHLSTPAS